MKIMLDKKDIRPIYASRICSPRRKSKTSSSRARISHTPTRPHFPADPPHYFKMSTATVTILYPAVAAGSDVKLFNMDYYLNTHMAMVQAQWTAYGVNLPPTHMSIFITHILSLYTKPFKHKPSSSHYF